MQNKSGKTSLAREISSDKVIAIDLDTDIWAIFNQDEKSKMEKLKNENINMFKLLFYPLCKRYLMSIFYEHIKPDMRIVIISSDIYLLRFLKVKVKIFLPDEKFYNEIGTEGMASRLDLIVQKDVQFYSSFSKLHKMVKKLL